MNEKLCSVIVPIYNVEKYIARCINSLLEQDYSNVQIILVDDGSTDSSGIIIDKLANNRENVIIIHKDNQGVSEARNTGLDYANGEYIMFVDGDDFVEYNYISRFVDLLEKTGLDMAVSYDRLIDDEEAQYNKEFIDIKNADLVLEEMYLEKVDVAVWNKVYRKSFLDTYKIRFKPFLWFAEGMTFNTECYLNMKEVVVSNLKLYHQVTNLNSAVRKFNLNSWYCGQKAMMLQKQLLLASKVNDNVINAWAYHYFGYDYVIVEGLTLFENSDNYKSEINRSKKNLRNNVLMPLRANVGLRKKMKCLIQSICPMVLIYMKKGRVRRKNNI